MQVFFSYSLLSRGGGGGNPADPAGGDRALSSGTLNQADFLWCEVVELVHDLIYEVVCCGNGLQEGANGGLALVEVILYQPELLPGPSPGISADRVCFLETGIEVSRPARSREILPVIDSPVSSLHTFRQSEEDQLQNPGVSSQCESVWVHHLQQHFAPAFVARVPERRVHRHSIAEQGGARSAEGEHVERDADSLIYGHPICSRFQEELPPRVEVQAMHAGEPTMFVLEAHFAGASEFPHFGSGEFDAVGLGLEVSALDSGDETG